MPRIAPLDPTQASPATAEALFGVKTKLGGLPNIILTLAHSPTALHGYLGFGSQQAQGLLDARQREIVALAVGQANRCGYCLAAHTVIGRGAGLNAEAIAAARAGHGLEPRDAALARFARTVVESRGNVDEREFEAFIGAGFGAGEAIEVVALVAQNTLTNYVNHLAGTAVDFPPVVLDLPSSQAA